MRFLLILKLLFVTPLAIVASDNPISYTYKEVDGRELKLHVFSPSDKATPVPAIVWYHGGGWRDGKAGQFFEHSKILAKRGMVSICVDFRGYAGEDETNRDLTPCIQDAKSAFRWVVEHSAELNIDAERIAAGGGSAGGQLAAALATLPSYNDDNDNLDTTTIPSLTILFNPALAPKGVSNSDVSPTAYISETTPEALIFHGTHDTTIPITDIYDYQRLLQEKGIECKVIVYAGEEHAFFNYEDGKNPYYYLTVGEALLYLEEKGYLQD